jgi:hypothetical protein
VGRNRVLLHTNLLREGGVWHPLGGLAGSALLHHLVNLFERQALGLGNEEISEEDASSTCRTPDEEDLGTQVALVLVNHVGSDIADDKVPEPVGGGGKSNTLGTNRQREDLANDDPSGGTPGGSEEEDVDADEDDKDIASGAGARSCGTDDGDDEFAEKHTNSAPDEERSATEAFNSPEGYRGGADVDSSSDHTNNEGALWDMGLGEEGRAIVEDEVDTSWNEVLAYRFPNFKADGKLTYSTAASFAWLYRQGHGVNCRFARFHL